jgi:NAD(P)-dependent dehydrogenase (short-subunit alcohol dehydrogenase family)
LRQTILAAGRRADEGVRGRRTRQRNHAGRISPLPSAAMRGRGGLRAGMAERKAVLITGASSGIGEVTAGELLRRGFRVYAGIRSDADAARLAAAGPRCTPLRLDVTDPASIAAAAEVLRDAGGVYGLVNNAGIAVSGPLEYLPLDDLRRQFEVNVVGAIAVTQALLPLLRRSLGRVVNVGSIAGRTPLPIVGPYSASKAALDSLTQSLRMELAPFDVLVSYIEPGSHRTPIWERSRREGARLRARLSPLARDYYGSVIGAMDALSSAQERRGGNPLRVAEAIAHALESPRPKCRYTIGVDTRLRFVIGLLPARLREGAILRRLSNAAPT